MTTPDDDEPLPASKTKAYATEQEFRQDVRVGDYVRAGRGKRLSLEPHTQYITKGGIYRVLDVAVVEGGFCLRTTTDLPYEATYLAWQDLDMKEPHYGATPRDP